MQHHIRPTATSDKQQQKILVKYFVEAMRQVCVPQHEHGTSACISRVAASEAVNPMEYGCGDSVVFTATDSLLVQIIYQVHYVLFVGCTLINIGLVTKCACLLSL